MVSPKSWKHILEQVSKFWAVIHLFWEGLEIQEHKAKRSAAHKADYEFQQDPLTDRVYIQGDDEMNIGSDVAVGDGTAC